MENWTVVLLTLLGVATALSAHLAYHWRKIAIDYREFFDNPNVQQVDKQAEYKDTYEAQINALDEERRQIQVALTEAFDYLNDNGPFGDNHQAGLMQVRNVLLRAISISTHGRG
jgi:hypothetical protein